MAIKKIPVPFCDVCGEPWLPKHRAADGTVNPLFEKPEKSKRCGKCKSTRWNADGVDRRRKVVVESPVEVPQVTVADIEQTLDQTMTETERLDHTTEQMADFANDALPGLKVKPATHWTVSETERCKHGLYSCPECHHQEAA